MASLLGGDFDELGAIMGPPPGRLRPSAPPATAPRSAAGESGRHASTALPGGISVAVCDQGAL